MLEVERSRLGFVRCASPRGVTGMAGFRALPSPLPLALLPSLLALLQGKLDFLQNVLVLILHFIFELYVGNWLLLQL